MTYRCKCQAIKGASASKASRWILEILKLNEVHWLPKIHKGKKIFDRSKKSHDQDLKALDQEIQRQNWDRWAAIRQLMSSRAGSWRERRATRQSSRFKGGRIHRSTRSNQIRRRCKNNTKEPWSIWEQKELPQMRLLSRQAKLFRLQFLSRVNITGWIQFWKRNRTRANSVHHLNQPRVDAQGNHWNQEITTPKPEAGQEHTRRSKMLKAAGTATGARNVWNKWAGNRWVHLNRIRGLKLHQRRRTGRRQTSSSVSTSKHSKNYWKQDHNCSKPISNWMSSKRSWKSKQ